MRLPIRLLKDPWGGNGGLVDCRMIPANRVLYPAGGGQVGKATPGRGRANTQAQPAARQAGKEVKRERIKICRTACISRVSRSQRSEVMHFASQTTLPPSLSFFLDHEKGFSTA